MKAMSLAQARECIGQLRGYSDWLPVDQRRIDGFAESSGDDAFIHTDPDAAARTRYRGTIAHGLLTLSLLPLMMRTALPPLSDVRMGANYGFERVRFITPVAVDSRLRGHFLLTDISERKPDFHVFRYEVQVEIDAAQPITALVATWLVGRWFGTGHRPPSS